MSETWSPSICLWSSFLLDLGILVGSCNNSSDVSEVNWSLSTLALDSIAGWWSEWSISWPERVVDVKVDELEGVVDKPKLSVLHCIRIPFLMRCGFWQLIHSYEYPCSSQSFPSDRTAGVSSRTFIVKNISNSLTYTVASSCVCTSPLAVMTIEGRHDFVKVSISAEFKSFLLIMCIDAPESTTNYLSAGLICDGEGRHQSSAGEKNVALSCSFNFFNTLLASFHAASRAPCSCHSVSSWDRSSNFGALGLRWWGSPGQKKSERRVLVSNFSVTCNSFREFHTLDWFLHVWALP